MSNWNIVLIVIIIILLDKRYKYKYKNRIENFYDVSQDKIILLCCTGRSGSTTLQRMINTIPDSNICGENHGAINSLLEFYKNIKYSSNTNIPGRKNPYSYEKLKKMNLIHTIMMK